MTSSNLRKSARSSNSGWFVAATTMLSVLFGSSRKDKKKNEEDYGRDWETGTKASKLKERKSEMKKKNKESILKTREAS